MSRRIPYKSQIKYRKNGEWTDWIDVLPKPTGSEDDPEPLLWTQEEADGWNEWAEFNYKTWGYKQRFVCDENKKAEVKYIDDFFNL